MKFSKKGKLYENVQMFHVKHSIAVRNNIFIRSLNLIKLPLAMKFWRVCLEISIFLYQNTLQETEDYEKLSFFINVSRETFILCIDFIFYL